MLSSAHEQTVCVYQGFRFPSMQNMNSVRPDGDEATHSNACNSQVRRERLASLCVVCLAKLGGRDWQAYGLTLFTLPNSWRTVCIKLESEFYGVERETEIRIE